MATCSVARIFTNSTLTFRGNTVFCPEKFRGNVDFCSFSVVRRLKMKGITDFYFMTNGWEDIQAQNLRQNLRLEACQYTVLGHSFVCGPQGEFLAEGDEADRLLLVDIDLTRSEQVRRWWPFLRDRRIEFFCPLAARYLDWQSALLYIVQSPRTATRSRRYFLLSPWKFFLSAQIIFPLCADNFY